MNSEIIETVGTYTQFYLYRVPKKNHEGMKRVLKEFVELNKKHGILETQIYTSSGVPALPGLTDIVSTVSMGQDEELWVLLDQYRDSKHRDEVVESMMLSPDLGRLFNQILQFITQGSSVIMGEFNRHNL
jgi:uncharacterized protein YbaA (DUF1428 family)